MFFVNVGEPPGSDGRGGYNPFRYNHDDPEEVMMHGWLDFIVGDAM